MKIRLLCSFATLALILSAPVHASIEDDLSGFETDIPKDKASEDLSGFEDDSFSMLAQQADTAAQELPEDTQAFVLSGNTAFKTSLGYKAHEVDHTSYSGFNQAQLSLYLQLDSKLSDNWKLRISGDMFYDGIYAIRSDNNYRQEVLDDYRTQLRFDDVYIQGKISSNLDLKAGRQIVVWGKSDTIRITDVINPLDNRLPGMTDIEDLRLSVAMAKFDYYLGSWNLSAMMIPENRIMYEATPRGEFFPVDAVFSAAPDPFLSLDTPSVSWDNMQYALAANALFTGWDLSLYVANVLDQKWHLSQLQGSAPISSMHREVSKINMLGSAVNIAKGSWLFKAEAAFLNGVKYNTTADSKNRLDALVGFDYMGIKDTVFTVEVANRHIFAYENQMAKQADFVDRNELQTALRLSRSFSHDTINLTALVAMFGTTWEKGGFARAGVEYMIMDALSADIGLIDYRGGNRPTTDAIKDNDRIFADIRYSF